MSSTSTALAASVSAVQTDADARAALGVISSILQDAYAEASQLTTDQGLQARAFSYLDTVNTYAQQVYADVPNDSADLSFSNSARLGLVASQTNDALDNVEQAIGATRWDLASSISQAVSEVKANVAVAAQGVGATVGAAAAAPFQGFVAALSSFLYSARVGLLILGGLGAVYLFRKPLGRALGKAAGGIT